MNKQEAKREAWKTIYGHLVEEYNSKVFDEILDIRELSENDKLKILSAIVDCIDQIGNKIEF